jgi:hypothetical protein
MPSKGPGWRCSRGPIPGVTGWQPELHLEEELGEGGVLTEATLGWSRKCTGGDGNHGGGAWFLDEEEIESGLSAGSLSYVEQNVRVGI